MKAKATTSLLAHALSAFGRKDSPHTPETPDPGTANTSAGTAKMFRERFVIRTFAALLAILAVPYATAADARSVYQFNLPEQPLSEALKAIGQQTTTNVLFDPGSVLNKTAPALRATLTAKQAIEHVLQGTDLTAKESATDTVLVQPPKAPSAPLSTLGEGGRGEAFPPLPLGEGQGEGNNTEGEGKGKGFWSRFRLAQADTASKSDASSQSEEQKTFENSSESSQKRIELEEKLGELIVTGTHIRGAAPVGSPVHVIDREDIDRAGFATSVQLIKSLPQNFGGDANNELPSTANFTTNVTGGTGVNLRGLGSAATLALLNGRRLAQASGLNGDFVDISSIPLTAIERVEVLTDGASAIYGSDAIAGVVNFILREDYEGAETRLRLGSDTEGGPQQYQLGQSWGTSWYGGNALIAYEYLFNGALAAEDRPYTAHADRRSTDGVDFRRNFSNPGTIISPALAGIPAGQDGSGLTSGDLLVGQPNLMEYAVGRNVFGEDERHNVFLTARQRLMPAVNLFGNLLFARRDSANKVGGHEQSLTVPSSNPYFVSPVPGATSVRVNYSFIDDFGPRRKQAEVTDYSSTLGGTYDFRSGWRFDFSGAFARQENESLEHNIDAARLNEALGVDNPATPFNPAVDGYFNPFGDGSNTSRNVLDYVFAGGNRFKSQGEAHSLDAKFDGTLFDLLGGSAKLAVGGQYREETYRKGVFTITGGAFNPAAAGNIADEKRDISSMFAEVTLPLFGGGNSRPGLRRLEFSAAMRHEDYSDFGTTSDPKFGAVWSPSEGLALRGSWGTSFKAPDLENMIPTNQFYLVVNLPAPGGTAPVFILSGSNPDLTPETSTTKTFGVDWRPHFIPGFKAELTYFDILFDKRIGTIPNFGLALLNPALYGPITTLNPDPAVVQSLYDSPYFFSDSGSGPPVAIVDGRLRNLAGTEVAGFDVTLSYDLATSAGELGFSLNGSYLRKFDETVTETSPILETVNTVNHPVDLRLRAGSSWSAGSYGAFVFINYADGYRDTESLTPRNLDSWTTVDLTLRYDVPMDRMGLMGGVTVSLTMQNLFNELPPLVNNSSGYDAANASAVGRVVALSVGKAW